jgi:hypothetical protein
MNLNVYDPRHSGSRVNGESTIWVEVAIDSDDFDVLFSFFSLRNVEN